MVTPFHEKALSIRVYICRANEGVCRHVARVRSLRLPGHRALAHSASTYISAACLIFMGIGQGVVALLWREYGAFEALRRHDGDGGRHQRTIMAPERRTRATIAPQRLGRCP